MMYVVRCSLLCVSVCDSDVMSQCMCNVYMLTPIAPENGNTLSTGQIAAIVTSIVAVVAIVGIVVMIVVALRRKHLP